MMESEVIIVDAVEYARVNIQELKDRLSQIDDKSVVGTSSESWATNSNLGLTEEECIAKFFKDQGLNFNPYDVEDIKALLTKTTEEE